MGSFVSLFFPVLAIAGAALQLARGRRTPTAGHAPTDVPRAHPAPTRLGVPQELAES
jgi:hypothetical protein